jgi:hypothetical protein
MTRYSETELSLITEAINAIMSLPHWLQNPGYVAHLDDVLRAEGQWQSLGDAAADVVAKLEGGQ